MKSAIPEETLSTLNLSFDQYKYKLKKPKIADISKPAIKRLFRRAGCKRVSYGSILEAHKIAREFLEHIIMCAINLCESNKRKTISINDVLYALKYNNLSIYM